MAGPISPEEALYRVREMRQIELSERLADVLDLPCLASAGQIAARVAALDHKPPPRRPDTCELLAAIALLGDDLADEFRGLNDELLIIGPGGFEMAEELLDGLDAVSERALGEDLGLNDADYAEHGDETVSGYIYVVLEGIVHEAYWRGWLRREAPPSPHEIALKKLAKRREKHTRRRGHDSASQES